MGITIELDELRALLSQQGTGESTQTETQQVESQQVETPKQETPQEQAVKTYTQAEVDAMVSDLLKQGQKAPEKQEVAPTEAVKQSPNLVPTASQTATANAISEEGILAMSNKEINKSWDKIEEYMAKVQG